MEAPDEIAIEADGSDEAAALSLSSGTREILTKADDRQVTFLHTKHKKGRLILQPDFHRHFVWDRKKASRLIESALVKAPQSSREHLLHVAGAQEQINVCHHGGVLPAPVAMTSKLDANRQQMSSLHRPFRV